MSEIGYLSAQDAEAMRSIAESSIAAYAEPDTDLLLDWENEVCPAVATRPLTTDEQRASGTRDTGRSIWGN